MQDSLLTCTRWAEQNFATVDLGDCRRKRRWIKVAAALAKNPGGTLPGAIPKWKDLKAAYRLLDNSAVTFEKVLTPHWQAVRNSCSESGEYLLIEDTTILDFSSHKSLKGIGRVGNDGGRGIYLHTTLAFRINRWEEEQPELSLLGLAGQHRWVREDELTRGNVRAGYERKKRRFTRPRESQRWGQVLAELPAPAKDNRRIYIADRESDIYEAFERVSAADGDFIIRGNQDRALLNGADSLFEAASKPAELGRYTLELRARPGVAARKATVVVRATSVVLRPPYRPGGKRPSRELFVVEAREENPPSADLEIHWVLLTSLNSMSYQQARRVIQLYTCRWLIEEYHKALKTGAGIENSQLEQAERIEALLGILSLVAVRLLNVKLEANASPAAKLRPEEFEPEALKILEAEFGLPPGGWTRHNLWITIARMGGFLARKSDGTPGWQTLWRGWNRLRNMTEGARLFRKICG
jgi:Transposase DNA-binding/Transposase DDE domain/Transposase Tn5 dimerisation domain